MGLRLDQIVFDAGTQVRAAINEHLVTHYAERMTAGDRFPAVVVFHDGNRYYMADGFHRGLAAQRTGLTEIPAEVKPGTATDALWFALAANKANGQAMTPQDKKHAILLALKTWPDRSGNQIAEQIGVNQGYVSELRKQVNGSVNLPSRVVGKDGKRYPASRRAKAGHPIPTPPPASQLTPPTPSHPKAAEIAARLTAGDTIGEIAKALKVAKKSVADVRNAMPGLSFVDKSRSAVAARLDRMRSLAADGCSKEQIAAEVKLTVQGAANAMRDAGIEYYSSKVTSHDSNRIVEQMALDAENLTADVSLIVFRDLHSAKVAGWIAQFVAARKALAAVITRLNKEQSRHEDTTVHAQAV